MNPFKTILAGAAITAIACCIMQSCSRDIPRVASTLNPGKLAAVQVFDATVKSARTYIYVDGVPVSGAALAFGAVFPGTAYAFTVSPGPRSFLIKDTLASSTQTPLSFSQAMDSGKSYTIFMYDTITSARQSTIQNRITVPKDSSCMLRFANFIYAAAALPGVDVYSYRRGMSTPVFTRVATNQVTDFIPYASGLTDTLYVYATGTTSPLQGKFFITSLTPTRSYTAAYAGSYKGTRSVSTFATY